MMDSHPHASPSPSAEPREFRHLLGHFASGVTVATTRDAKGRAVGMTASAVASVSLDPPLVLLCVNHEDRLHDALLATSRFAINVLADDQEALSRRFADALDDRFAGVAHRTGPEGVPLLENVVAYILCERWDVVPVGDHTVFVGRVTGGETFERKPLVHFRGGYTTAR